MWRYGIITIRYLRRENPNQTVYLGRGWIEVSLFCRSVSKNDVAAYILSDSDMQCVGFNVEVFKDQGASLLMILFRTIHHAFNIVRLVVRDDGQTWDHLHVDWSGDLQMITSQTDFFHRINDHLVNWKWHSQYTVAMRWTGLCTSRPTGLSNLPGVFFLILSVVRFGWRETRLSPPSYLWHR